jgi:hypothetical protein
MAQKRAAGTMQAAVGQCFNQRLHLLSSYSEKSEKAKKKKLTKETSFDKVKTSAGKNAIY